MKQTWLLSAIDTLFFRESRPMEAPGSSELGSVFPPPMRTLAGAIRSHIGEIKGVDWSTFESNQELRNIIGFGDEDYAKMKFQGVWLHYKGERLYPAPLNLMIKRGEDDERDTIKQFNFLEVDEACQSDLGKNVRFVSLPEDMKGSQSLSNHWITAKGMQLVMGGQLPKPEDIISSKLLLKEENRLGIARDNQKRVVRESMLYQTRHLRLEAETLISVDISGLEDHLTAGIIKLGGEGRMATLQSVKQEINFPKIPNNVGEAVGIIIYLLTPMLLPKESEFLPGFKKTEKEGSTTIWQGELNGVSLNLISSVIGKVHREGGWDVAQHKPIDVKSMIPAGSVFYCETQTHDLMNILSSLNNIQIGEQQHLGRGHIATGLWFARKTKGHTS